MTLGINAIKMLNCQIFDTTGASNMTLGGGISRTLCFRGFLELEM